MNHVQLVWLMFVVWNCIAFTVFIAWFKHEDYHDDLVKHAEFWDYFCYTFDLLRYELSLLEDGVITGTVNGTFVVGEDENNEIATELMKFAT